MAEATDILSISKAFVRLIRDNIFEGEELALIEPFNGPRPPKTHCTIKFIRAKMFQHPIKEWIKDPSGNRQIFELMRGTRYCTYRVMFFGTGANQKSVECQNWMKSTLGAEFTLSQISGFGQIGEVQDATTENLAYQEERSFFNVELYAKFSQAFDWMEVEKVTVNVYRNGSREDIIKVEVVNENNNPIQLFYLEGESVVVKEDLPEGIIDSCFFFVSGETIFLQKEIG